MGVVYNLLDELQIDSFNKIKRVTFDREFPHVVHNLQKPLLSTYMTIYFSNRHKLILGSIVQRGEFYEIKKKIEGHSTGRKDQLVSVIEKPILMYEYDEDEDGSLIQYLDGMVLKQHFMTKNTNIKFVIKTKEWSGAYMWDIRLLHLDKTNSVVVDYNWYDVNKEPENAY